MGVIALTTVDRQKCIKNGLLTVAMIDDKIPPMVST